MQRRLSVWLAVCTCRAFLVPASKRAGWPTSSVGRVVFVWWRCWSAAILARHGPVHRARLFAARFGGRWPRIIAAFAAVLCSFTYVVAQIYGVGLITSRLTGVQFEIGILLGLGGVLVCSFLGGMRAVTWTQVVQYAIIILAFLIPVSWLSYKQVGNPFAPLAYGQQLEKIATLERSLKDSPAEQSVRDEYARRAERLEQKLLNAEQACKPSAGPAPAIAGGRGTKIQRGDWHPNCVAKLQRCPRMPRLLKSIGAALPLTTVNARNPWGACLRTANRLRVIRADLRKSKLNLIHPV